MKTLTYFTHLDDVFDYVASTGELVPNGRSASGAHPHIILSTIEPESLSPIEIERLHEGSLHAPPHHWIEVVANSIEEKLCADPYNQYTIRAPYADPIEAMITAHGSYTRVNDMDRFDPIAFMRTLGYLE